MFSFLRTAMDYIQSASGLKVKPQSAELMDDDSEVICMKRVPSSRKSAFFSSLLIFILHLYVYVSFEKTPFH